MQRRSAEDLKLKKFSRDAWGAKDSYNNFVLRTLLPKQSCDEEEQDDNIITYQQPKGWAWDGSFFPLQMQRRTLPFGFNYKHERAWSDISGRRTVLSSLSSSM